MRARGRILVLLGLLLAGTAPLLALNDPAAEEMADNRTRLSYWKSDPRHYERLLQELRDFLSLPPAAQERMRHLDQELHQEKPSVRAHLFDVMERYADWLDRLPPEERKQIQETHDGKARLRLVRAVRERQWIERLPRADQERLAAAQTPQERQTLLARLHERERDRRREWVHAFQHWEDLFKRRPPLRPGDIPGLQNYLKEYLLPRLDPEERRRLQQALNRPQLFPRVLVELADRHPPALVGSRGPTRWEELPAEVRRRLDKVLNLPRFQPRQTFIRQQLKKAEGKWPQFGIVVARIAHRWNITLPHELWPADMKDLSEPVKKFVQKQLLPELGPDEEERLNRSRGSWPNFPDTIKELAGQHHLQVPWFTLPPDRARWDVYRPRPRLKDLPEVSRHSLLTFYKVELNSEERAGLRFSQDDPASWERLKRMYFQKKPKELKRLREAEQGKRPGKKKKGKNQ